MIFYNKLVRDKIPEIIKKKGDNCNIEILDDKLFYHYLIKKLNEEVQEFIESDSNEEIADILEVLDSILKHKDVSWEYIRKIQDFKRNKNGGFESRMFLVSVD
jgi:predicted house-cleaning noncanonical NTP pyrophosphatase (MazG superfamily)